MMMLPPIGQPVGPSTPVAPQLIQYTPMARLREAREFAENAPKKQIEAIVEAISQLIFREGLERIKTQGSLHMLIRLTDIVKIADVDEDKVVGTFSSLGEVSLEYHSKLEESLKGKFNPCYLELGLRFDKRKAQAIEKIKLTVSVCERHWELNQQAVVVKDRGGWGFKVHDLGINDVQSALHQAEQEYLNRPVDEVKVQHVVKTIFDAENPDSPITRIMQAIQKGETQNIRILFNHSDLDFDSTISLKEKNLFARIEKISLAEIVLFIQKVQAEQLGTLPYCRPIDCSYVEGKTQYSYGKEISGDPKSCKRLMAEYTV